MSDLHLSLIGFGLLVIVGVVAYNWIQEQKFRKIAQQRFQAPREDVLMTNADPTRGPATIARETLDDVRIEPRLSAAQPVTEPVVAEHAIEAPLVPRVSTASPHKSGNELPAPIDAVIDYVVRLDFAEAMQAEAVRVALGEASFGKPVIWCALNATGQWEDLVLLEIQPKVALLEI